MITSDNIVTKTIDLHLFFMRIMKEHMLFIEAAFTPQNFGMQATASKLREQAETFLGKVVSVASGNVSEETLSSGEIATKYTSNAEMATSYYTKIPIDTNITSAEHALIPRTNMNTAANETMILNLNNEAYKIVTDIINYKTALLSQVLKCSLFTLNYPLLIDHILREAKHYLEAISKLQNPVQGLNQNELLNEEIFWNNIMAEHSKFIRGLLDPTEEELLIASNMFANSFDELTKEAIHADNNMYELAGVTKKSLNEVEKIKGFKEQGTEGLLNCKIKSIILPLLADHVLREANHYFKLLKTCR